MQMKHRRRTRDRSPADNAHHPKSFVKIILPSSIHGAETRIPELFIRSFGDELFGSASITVHNGDHWNLGLKKCGEGDVWFSNKWQDFAKFYSISYGSVLHFEYEGGSKFRVRIYDTTATEIRYPCKTQGGGPGRPRKRSRLDEYQHHQQQQQQQQASYETRSKKHKEVEITDRVDDNGNVSLPSKNQRSASLRRQGKSRHKRKRAAGGRGGRGKILRSNSSSERAKKAATKLKPKNPCFEATIRNCPVYIPAEFAIKHLKQKDPIKLQNSSEQSWDVSCIPHCRTSGARRLSMTGWKDFARENNVSPGDVCEFELIKRRPVVLKVQISRTCS